MPTRPGSPAPAPSAPVATGPSTSQRTPKPPAGKKVAGRELVALPEVAARLGLRLTAAERGRKVTLAGADVRAELERDSREISANGLRVFLGDPVVESGGQLHVTREDFERALTPLLSPGWGSPAPAVPKLVVLDPGHGGKDNGTSANEKTYALDVARRAKALLEKSGYRVLLTREADTYLELTQRSAVAVAKGAQLFVSIHFNALPNDARTSGVEVFTFAPVLQRSTNSWGPREGGDAEREAAPANRHDHWSSVLAHAVQRRFVQDLKSFDRGKKIAHWGVLRGLNCPGVLVECGFLTSQQEARRIATPGHRQRIAEAIAEGVRDYAATAERSRAGRTAGP